MADKQLPHSLEAEEAVLGALLIDNDAYFNVCNTLTADDFFRDKNRTIYVTRQRMDFCDQVTMAHELSKSHHLEEVGGAAYLSHLIANCASSVHAAHYAEILHNLGNARRIIKAGVAIQDMGFEQRQDGVTEAIKLLLGMEGRSRNMVSPDELADYAFARFDKLANEELKPVLFGLQTLDRLGGMQPGELVILGGETEMGKTTMLDQIARHQAPNPVLFCTTEMTRAQWAQRQIARIMHTYMQNLGNADYIKKHMREILDASMEFRKTNVHIITGGVSVNEIYTEAASLNGCCLIVIDYLQRLKGVRASYESVSSASREIADMAKILETPIVLSSQLSRDSQIGKDGKVINRPLLTRLKDSGNIENDADWVMFIQREKGAKKGTPDFLKAKLLIEKHKQGGDHLELGMTFIPHEQMYKEDV